MAMTGTNVPPGWHYDVMNMRYKGPNGEIITEMDILNYGSLAKAIANRNPPMQGMVTNTSSGPSRTFPPNPAVGDLHTDTNGELFIYTQQGWISNNYLNGAAGQGSMASMPVTNAGSLSISNSTQPANTLSFETDHGRITLNVKNGDLTLPVGMSRDDGAREFWLGFHRFFNTGDNSKYEKKIKDLEYDAIEYKRLWKESEKITNKKVADKIRTKYNGQKLIMVKPEDLAKFIEDV